MSNLNLAAYAPPGGTMAAPGRQRYVKGAVWCQNVCKNILVTETKFGAPTAHHFQAIYDISPGGGLHPPPRPTKG